MQDPIEEALNPIVDQVLSYQPPTAKSPLDKKRRGTIRGKKARSANRASSRNVRPGKKNNSPLPE